ncbi:hypothetical protein BPT24_092 [Tenacibaculum phage pT24]|uniref:Uncharacterized protein n=1 Tax=Tenacibaculum phage pT24 TaxID=1880590 RepID=A0A1B4XWQ0_9CAUD|nr:hypothetical protein HYP10_gp092 [Tenacibaculum phage pT24]BAV39217.1 hypothetical protein BPT24_092 [Tenacibaculum phage pT24]
MRRTKVEITNELKENVKLITDFLNNDFQSLKKMVEEAEPFFSELHKMKHTDYQKVRKILLNISRESMNIRKSVLDTHKIFTKDKTKET